MKLRLRKNDFERVHQIEQRREIMVHKERTEALYRAKLEEEKRKVMRAKMDEVEEVIRENRGLKEEIHGAKAKRL